MLKNKKGAMPVIMLIALLIGIYASLCTLGYLPKPAFLLGEDTVWVSNWGTMECEKSPKAEEFSRYADDISTVECKEFTDLCEVNFKCMKKTFGCYFAIKKTGIAKETITLPAQRETDYYKLKQGEKIEVLKAGLTDDRDYVKWTKTYHVWQLRSEEYGKDYISGSDGCKLPYWSKDQVEDKACIEAGRLTMTGSCRIVNYITNWQATIGNIETYQGREVLCQARILYDIDTFEFVDGSERKIQGNKIKAVECCPKEPNCRKDFTFGKEWEEKPCSYDYECFNDPMPIDATHYKIEKCIGEECIWQSPVEVECTTTAECLRTKGEGYVCDLTPANYGKCIESLGIVVCGDGYCDELEGENEQNCPADCTLKCKENEKLVIKTKKVNCLVGFPLYMGCDEEAEYKCVPKIPYLTYILIGLGVLILIFFHRQIIALFRAIFGRLIPI